jgi:nucleoid DNA-binding protein
LAKLKSEHIFDESHKEIIKQIAQEQDISEKETTEIVILFFYCLNECMKRGVNVSLNEILLKVSNQYRGILRNQRLGDQKAVVGCIKWNRKVNEQRLQTITLINKYKKQNKNESDEF